MTDYDAEARRDTPLALKLKERIGRDGPILVSDYMQACLYDPEHGYYTTRAAIGAGGDFVTAPEVSQVFGELIGLWCAVVWQQMGAPPAFDLVELGPGRGTLMADALRALAKVPACLAAARVQLIEVSPVLRDVQQARLAGAHSSISWRASLRDAGAPMPSIVLANEVLDAQPIDQLAGFEDGVQAVRVVALDGRHRLQFRRKANDIVLPDRPDLISEALTWRSMHEIAELPQVAALLIDYGHERSAPGDTLQAVRNHRYEHPLTSPGEADLTAQVDFGRLARLSELAGLAVDGPVTQAGLLGALGVAERASRLMAANPRRAGEIEASVARLISPTGMGTRFKAIGLRSPALPPLPGLASPPGPATHAGGLTGGRQ